MLTSDAHQIVSGNELNQMSGGVSGALHPITEFHDLVPNNYLPSMPTTKVQMVQGKNFFLIKINYKKINWYYFHQHSYNNRPTEATN